MTAIRSIPEGQVKYFTEHYVELPAPGQYIAEAEMTLVYGISCEKSDDRQGFVRARRGGKMEFECPVALLMDATVTVGKSSLEEASKAANELLLKIAEHPEKYDADLPKLINKLCTQVKPMVEFITPFALREKEDLRLERWGKYGEELVPIARPVTCYLHTMRIWTVR